MSHLRNKTAIVTGSSQGIGKAIAAHFTEQGANVIVNSRTLERAEAAATKIAEETDGRTVPVAADVTDEAAMSALVETTVEEFGGSRRDGQQRRDHDDRSRRSVRRR